MLCWPKSRPSLCATIAAMVPEWATRRIVLSACWLSISNNDSKTLTCICLKDSPFGGVKFVSLSSNGNRAYALGVGMLPAFPLVNFA